MKPEELFLAIGGVEDEKLLRSELTLQESSPIPLEDSDMKKKRVSLSRLLRSTVAAVLIVSTLAVTAFAAAGFLLFDNPKDMLEAIFGDKTGFDHSAGSIQPDPQGPPTGIIVEPTYDRVPADEKAVEEAAPLVDAVGQSIKWNGYTLTIDANLYDAATRCGLVTYTVENPNGLGYEVHSDGQVWRPEGELVDVNQYGYSHIILDKTTPTKLAATYYYQLRNPETTDLVLGFTQWASTTQEEIDQRIEEIKQQLRQEISEEEALEFQKAYVGDSWPWFEENRTREENIDSAYEAWAYEQLEEVITCPDKIIIPEQPQSEMASITLGDGAVTMSSIAMTLDMPAVGDDGSGKGHKYVITFTDGSEYVVEDGYTLNRVFAVGDMGGKELTIMFNRILDVQKVSAIIIDDSLKLKPD